MIEASGKAVGGEMNRVFRFVDGFHRPEALAALRERAWKSALEARC